MFLEDDNQCYLVIQEASTLQENQLQLFAPFCSDKDLHTLCEPNKIEESLPEDFKYEKHM